ncbi:MAG: divergent polysaccharide deacetylase family protein [Thiovulaceae bacterium]|nr:divergent polysaccharide deacetylase family protein [Sulfurimonadaceae bacterium]
MSKKRKKSQNFVGAKKALSVLIISSLFILTIFTIAVVSYNIGFEEAEEESAEALYRSKAQSKLLRDRLKRTLKDSKDSKLLEELPEPKPYEKTPDYRKLTKQEADLFEEKIPTLTHKHRKPRLAIILDDVSYPYEVRAVKRLGIKVNFSFFPVAKNHPQTAYLASKEPFFMVHLPLEAMNYNAEEAKTLKVTDSLYTINKRLERIKADFPNLKYLNNHTGSKFTSNEKAVEKLLYAANNLNLEIVDSRTTSKTKLPKVAKSMNTHLYQRDIFLDHESDISYICGQIREAVDMAKQRGKAIAIGHPRPHTIKALKKCKSVLAQVELVYLKDL